MNASQSLSPPGPVHRAESSNLRGAFTLHTLGRRRSTSCLQSPDTPTEPTSQPPPLVIDPQLSTPLPPPPPAQSSSMSLVFISRLLEWLHVDPKHSRSWSTPYSSPRSSMDEPVLPLSAPPYKEVFDTPLTPPTTQNSPSIHAPILIVLLLLPISTAVVLFSLSTLPISMSWPRTLADVAQLGRELHGYAQSGIGPLAHVVGVMSITAVWKHAWSIPGSVIWNVLAGALFSPAFATVLLTLLTTIGSLCSTLLSMPLAPLLTQFFPRALEVTRHAIEGDDELGNNEKANKSSPWVRLSILRLVGVVPWSGINVACGVCGVAIGDCFLGAFIGSLPWTAVTCQIGDILQTLAATPSPNPQTISSVLTSPEIILKLVFLSFLSLAPILARDKLRSLISQSTSSSPSVAAAGTKATGSWVQDWRAKLRLSGRSASSMSTQEQLQTLIQEKRAQEDLSS
ncbi:hypothetical protein BDN72DRAFT_891719 [Pluteus cervinus]|uniref:Uncharacterized protein n=1 Tax=Pluteus cervinus TaxID=181527 RepID=A0ACD3BDB7_9AGAR|nr:hypothetical protein BDN72DRAFT_891719 [Pluteus cervinus]